MHALIKDNEILRTYDFRGEAPPTLAPSKGQWLPVVEDADPVCDSRTHYTLVATEIYSDQVVISKSVLPRALPTVQAELIATCRLNTSDAILAEAPEHVQRNVGIGGIYSTEEDDRVRNVIRTHRDAFHAKEAAINAATTVQDALTAFLA